MTDNDAKLVLIHDTPASQGALNVIKRAKQHLNIRWTPIKPVPKLVAKATQGVFPAGEEVTGLPYTSARLWDKFVGVNLSMETFITALQNPDSVIYTENLFGVTENAAGYYGTVCSIFVGYALNLPYRVPTKLWPEIKGMHKLQNKSAYDVRLCDTLLNKKHVAIIIDITRTLDGRIHSISVAEAKRPQCICTELSPEEFENIWFGKKQCDVYRYDYLASVPYEPIPYVQVDDEPEAEVAVNSVLGLNFGNKANYKKGETVAYNIMESGWKKLNIRKDGELLETVQLAAVPEKVTRNYTVCGSYEACCEDAEGKTGAGVSFKVVYGSLATEKTAYKAGEDILVSFAVENEAGTPLCLTLNNETQNMVHIHEFTAEEKMKQQALTSWSEPGIYGIKLYVRNEYGVYPSDYLKILIE